jgi:hypothetical protein
MSFTGGAYGKDEHAPVDFKDAELSGDRRDHHEKQELATGVISSFRHHEMPLDEWLASPEGLHAVRWHAAWKRVPESEAVKSYLSNIMVQDASLLRLDPKPIDYNIDGIRRLHLQHVQFFARMGWDVPPGVSGAVKGGARQILK